MRLPPDDDPELMALVRRFVISDPSRRGRYLKLLHGNALGLRSTDRASFMEAMSRDARQITDHELSILLDSDWRPKLTAAWLIGLDRRAHFRDRLGECC